MAATKKTAAKAAGTEAAPVEALENVAEAPKAEEKKTVKKAAKETVKKTAKAVKAVEETEKAVEAAEEKPAPKKRGRKPAVKAAEASAAEEKPAEAAKSAAKKAGRKPAKAVKEATAEKEELTASISVQFAGKSYTNEELVRIAKDVWQYDLKKDEKDLKSVELYVKPEESTVYYVFNGTEGGSFGI